jgi:hypothetical protein
VLIIEADNYGYVLMELLRYSKLQDQRRFLSKCTPRTAKSYISLVKILQGLVLRST